MVLITNFRTGTGWGAPGPNFNKNLHISMRYFFKYSCAVFFKYELSFPVFLFSFGAESFVFQVAIQKHKD
jgi:hypothetical protein